MKFSIHYLDETDAAPSSDCVHHRPIKKISRYKYYLGFKKGKSYKADEMFAIFQLLQRNVATTIEYEILLGAVLI